MGPNRNVTFKLADFERFGGFDNMPKGQLLRLSVNPYNGTVVFCFQDRHENASDIIESVFNQVTKDLRLMRMCGHDVSIKDFADYMEGKKDYDLRVRLLSVGQRKMGRRAS